MQPGTETEIKIINAATEVFLQKGKDGARMQEIADRAGINKALLHYYFRSKDKMFEQVFFNEIKSLVNAMVTAVIDTDDFPIFLRTFISTYLDNIIPRKNLMRFVLWESDYFSKNVADQFLAVFNDRGFEQNPLMLKIEQAIAAGQIRPLRPHDFILSLLGMCVFPLIAAPVMEKVIGIDIMAPDLIETRKQEIFNLIWDGIKPQH